MEQILKSIGWKEIYPDTIKRLTIFKDGFREYFSHDEISDKELEDAVAYSFGIYGQGMVYEIYCKLKRETESLTMGEIVRDFVMAFKESLSELTLSEIKPRNYINLFIELLFSYVIKGT